MIMYFIGMRYNSCVIFHSSQHDYVDISRAQREKEIQRRREPKLSGICISPSCERRLTNNAAWSTGRKSTTHRHLYCPGVIFVVVVTRALLTSENKYRSPCKLGRIEVCKRDIHIHTTVCFLCSCIERGSIIPHVCC